MWFSSSLVHVRKEKTKERKETAVCGVFHALAPLITALDVVLV